MKRLGPALLAALALTFAAPSLASAADVTVNFARGGGSKTVSLSSVSGAFDVNSAYALIGASGATTTRQISGISLRALLDAVGADPTYSAVTIARPEGGAVRISRAQLEAGGLTPVVYDDGGRATFVRPAYSATDQNATDVVSGSPLVITQVDGTDYDLKATPASKTVKVGETVKFNATATGAAGQKLTIKWNFNDGTTGDGEAVAHKFKKRGYYRVLVTVSGEGDSTSNSTVLKIQVGKAAKSKKQREGGGTNDAAGAPISGQSDGSDGAGDDAGSADAQKPAPKQKKSLVPEPQPALPTVTGELLSAQQAEPEQQQSLAARSGNPSKAGGGSAGVPDQAIGAAAALGLLGFGALLELGTAGRLRRRVLG